MRLDTGRPSRNQRAREVCLAAAVEALERRLLLSSVVVNTTADVIDPAGSTVVSLRDAVDIANKSATATTITFDSRVFAAAKSILLNGSDLELSATQPVTITGPAAGVTVNGNDASADFTIDSGASVTISGLTITGGSNSNGSGGGIENDGSLVLNNCLVANNAGGYGNGGGIDNAGTLALNDTTVSNNMAGYLGDGGGIENEAGAKMTLTNVTVSGNSASDSGGIENKGAAKLIGVTVSDNTAQGFGTPGGFGPGSDGGIGNYGTMTLTDCTVSGNSNGLTGGGIGNHGALTLADSTVSGNTAGGGEFGSDYGTSTAVGMGGGLFIDSSSSSTIIRNTIIAGNQVLNGTGADVWGAVQSSGYNLIGQTDGSTGWKSTDLTGTAAHPRNALLSTLGPFGGPTQSIVPLAGSPAIDHGSNALVPVGLKTDQRGFPRVANGTVDIGSVEAQPTTAHIVVTTRAGLTAVEGEPAMLSPGNFTESGATGPFTVAINWGDGPIDDALSASASGAAPAGTHTYAEEGVYHGTLAVIDARGHASGAVPFTVNVADAPLSGSASDRSGIAAGVPFAAQVATFADADPNGTVSYYSARINWGDGTTSAGVVASATLGETSGPFTVTGGHTYSKAGAYKVTVTVKDFGGSTLSVSATYTCVNAKVIVVNTTGDQPDPAGDKTISLRDAVALANEAAVPTTISFDPRVFATAKTITLNGPALQLTGATTIDITGPAAGVTISGDNQNGVLEVGAGVSAVLTGVTIANGNVANEQSDADDGGGIANGGTLLMTDCSIVNNDAYDGGGMDNNGFAALTDCTISGNQASDGAGGIENSDGKMVLTNCTVAGNSAESYPGGIDNGGELTLYDCTISANTGYEVGGINQSSSGLLKVANSIIAGNIATGGDDGTPDIAGANEGGFSTNATVDSLGFNLVGDASETSGWASTDQTGTAAHPLGPLLSPLASFGGPTQTLVPMAGSAAIDHGSNALVPSGVSTDQRGLPRIANGVVDIGAVEVQPSKASIVVTARKGLKAVEGEPASISPASFTATGAAAPYLVAVNWGDGSGVDLYAAAAPGAVPAHSHAFPEEGSYHGTITVYDATGRNSATVPFTVSVADAPLSGSAKGRSNIAAGVPFAIQAAAFTDANPNGTASDFTATIDWGDGTTSAGVVASTTLGDTTGPFGVTGTHTYAKAGTYTFVVSVKDVGGSSLTVSSTNTCVNANVIVVNTTKDQSDPPGSKTVSLRDAVALADNSTTPTTIRFDPGVFASAATITLGSELELSGKSTINIVGPTTVLTISGNNMTRVFQIDHGASASFVGLTIADGGTAGITSGSTDGACVLNEGILFLTNCSVGNGISSNGDGGGIANVNGFAVLDGDTVWANQALDGGGIENQNGKAILINCTVADNIQDPGEFDNGGGGGINNSGGTVTLEDCTVSGNAGAYEAGGVSSNDGEVIIANTIIAGNINTERETGTDVSGYFVSLGYNFIGDAFGGEGWVSTDTTGTFGEALGADLSPLGNHGGPTQTFLPLPGSPVINKGSNALVPQGLATDQRGLPRIVDGIVDIGAVEVQ